MKQGRYGSGERDPVTRRLLQAGLRPTWQSVELLRLMSGGPCHWTARALAERAQEAGLHLPTATIYNVLNAFAERGLVRPLRLTKTASVFDTDTAPHLYAVNDGDGRLVELPRDPQLLSMLSSMLGGIAPDRIEVLVRIRAAPGADPALKPRERENA